MFRKILVAAAFSTFALSNAYAGDIGAAADAIKAVANLQGNAAVGVNNGELLIDAEASGKDSSANAGLAVVDTKGGQGGLNAAVGVNNGTATISSAASGKGSNANAGLAVVRTQGTGK